jgi:hypothetical protein
MSSTTSTPDRIIRIGVRIDDQVVEERVVGLRKDVALGKRDFFRAETIVSSAFKKWIWI